MTNVQIYVSEDYSSPSSGEMLKHEILKVFLDCESMKLSSASIRDRIYSQPGNNIIQPTAMQIETKCLELHARGVLVFYNDTNAMVPFKTWEVHPNIKLVLKRSTPSNLIPITAAGNLFPLCVCVCVKAQC